MGSTGGTDTRINFVNGNVRPATSSGGHLDNSLALGHSQSRWSDVYVGGNIYLGGTGSANQLDDYEEGTFTPTIASGGFTSNSNVGEYTKVGNIVHIRMGFVCNSNASTSDVGGLPFPVTGSTAYSSFYPASFQGDSATNAPINPAFKIGTSLVSFKEQHGTVAHNINTTISTYRVAGFYYTTS